MSSVIYSGAVRTTAKTAFIICSAILLSLSSRAAEKEKISVATLVFPPYILADTNKMGAATEIVVAAFDKAGYKATIHRICWADAVAQCREGKYDAVYPAYYSDERMKVFLISEPFLAGPVMLCSKKGSEIEYTDLKSLESYRIGIVKGYVNAEEFDAAKNLNKIVGETDLENLQNLLRGELDLIVIEKLVGIHLLTQHLSKEGGVDAVKFLNPALAVRDFYVMFPRSLPSSADRMKAFDKAIKKMKKGRKIEEIMEKHHFK